MSAPTRNGRNESPVSASTDIAARDDQTPAAKRPVPLQGPIADLESAYRYASALAQADILPYALRGKPSNVLTVMLYGQYLDLPPVVAIQTISVINGRPQLAGKLVLAKVREAGHKPEVVEHTDESCTVRITRGDDGSSHQETFTLAEAVHARLVQLKDGKPHARSKQGEPLPWETYTKRMLLWRAVGLCADVICPEVKMGFAVEGEEITDTGKPTLAQVAAEREDRAAAAAGTPPETAPTPEVAPEQQAADDEATLAEIADIEAQHTGQADYAETQPVLDETALDPEPDADEAGQE